jgi:4a-hydroxytetrahydrobiopterin dehydratase
MSSTEPLMLPPGWTIEKGKLHRVFSFRNFTEAFGFMTKVAIEANTLNHHPEFHNIYNQVTIDLITHDAGDVITALDVTLATKINALLTP